MEKPSGKNSTKHGRGPPPGIPAEELTQSHTSGKAAKTVTNSMVHSVRGQRGRPPGIPASAGAGSTFGQGIDLGSISQALAAQGGSRPKLQPYVLVPSSAVARHTRGRERAKQMDAQEVHVPDLQVPDLQVPEAIVPGSQVPDEANDVVMQDTGPGPSRTALPTRKSSRKKASSKRTM